MFIRCHLREVSGSTPLNGSRRLAVCLPEPPLIGPEVKFVSVSLGNLFCVFLWFICIYSVSNLYPHLRGICFVSFCDLSVFIRCQIFIRIFGEFVDIYSLPVPSFWEVKFISARVFGEFSCWIDFVFLFSFFGATAFFLGGQIYIRIFNQFIWCIFFIVHWYLFGASIHIPSLGCIHTLGFTQV